MSIWKATWVSLLFLMITYLSLLILLIPKFFIDFKNYHYYFLVFVESLTHIISFLVIQKLFIKESISSSLNDKSITKKYILLLLIITFGEIISSKVLIDINDTIFSIAKSTSSNKGHPPILYFLLKIIKGCVIAPILEEIYFRNFIQKKLNEKYSAFIAIFISSLLFALSHMNLSNILPSLILGIVLGIVFQKTKKIKYSIYLHSFHNFFALMTIYYWYNLDLFSFIKKFSINYWIVIFIGVIILYFGLKLFFKNFEKEKTKFT